MGLKKQWNSGEVTEGKNALVMQGHVVLRAGVGWVGSEFYLGTLKPREEGYKLQHVDLL